jgi:hypothetical protein
MRLPSSFAASTPRIPSRKKTHSVCPRLELLEDRTVPSYLAAEFHGHGAWLFNSTDGSWQNVTAADASQVAADRNGDVVAEIPGQGVWLYSRSVWQQLTASDATSLAIGNYHGVDIPSHFYQQLNYVLVVAEFPGYGVWHFALNQWTNVNTGWQPLTANNASTLATDDAGNVVAEFPGWGVWYYAAAGVYGNGSWQQLTAADASSLALGTSQEIQYMPYPHPVNGPTYVAAAFPGHGVWRMQVGQAWQQLTASNAATVGVNVHGDVVGAFPGNGVWSYSDAGAGGYNSGWNQLTAADAALVGIDAAGNVYGQFPGWGVWYDQVGSWQLLTASNASSFGVGG